MISLFKGLDLSITAGERVAVIIPNGIGKTTLLSSLIGDLVIDAGLVKWAEGATIGYYAQDHATDFESDLSLLEWMAQWKKEADDEQKLRSVLGRLLFAR